MNLRDLVRYDVPVSVLELWEQCQGPALLPLQELAVKRHDLFGSGNLLIQAPTSSGKTFIGEMASIHTALRRQKVVYLVPLKALAEEKYLDFRAKYEAYGLRVIVCTRDHRDFDADLESGNFSIAVVVYEKLAQLLVRRPERLEEIELIIADELEILSDPDRGAMAEILITRILQAQRRLIGLSAVIGESERLAAWLNASLVHHDHRPVELRHGVLFEGRFHYRTCNAPGEGSEVVGDSEAESPWEALSGAIAELAGRGESCLVFAKAKHESRRMAERLATRLELAGAPLASEALRGLDGTRTRDMLLETLRRGVAFHNADLSPDERRIVEQAFRAGEVKVLVSTSTLAVGLNLPARNVFLSVEKWRYDPRLDTPWKAPILHAEYENMAGRAGRYGAGHPFGRALLLAPSRFDFEALWRRYVNGDRERIEPQLDRAPLENHLLRLVAARFCRTIPEAARFLDRTLTGRWVWGERHTLEEIERRVRNAVHRCVDDGVLACAPDDRIAATPLGVAVAAKGIGIGTAAELRHWLAQSDSREWTALDLLLAACLTPDGRALQVMLTAREYEEGGYPAELRRCAAGEPIRASIPLHQLASAPGQPLFEHVRAMKTALFLQAWIGEAAVREIEERYDTMAGQVLSAAEQTAWLLDAAAAIAHASGLPAALTDRVLALANRVRHGVREHALPLARARVPGVQRAHLIALANAGLASPQAIAAAPAATLSALVPAAAAHALHAWAVAAVASPRETPTDPLRPPPRRQKAARAPGESAGEDLLPGLAQGAAPVLVIDEAHPCEVVMDGIRINLGEKSYELMRLLARHAGECVGYEQIYAQLWEDAIVQDNQLAVHKCELLKRIKSAVPARARCIETVRGRGFRLHLTPPQVVVRTRKAAARRAHDAVVSSCADAVA